MDLLTNNLVNSSIKHNSKDKSCKVKKNTDDCQELNNIAYKTMLLNGNDIKPKYNASNSSYKISDFLENESNASKKESWSKLDKTQKIIKLNNYTNTLQETYSLSDKEVENLKIYFIKCLDRKSLIKSKEIVYNKNDGTIENIPCLLFIDTTRTFVLKKDDKHISTIKCLPSDKKAKTKTIKNN